MNGNFPLLAQGCQQPGARDFPQLLFLENRRKIEPKEIPSRLIPHLLVVFTRQLEILVTTLLASYYKPKLLKTKSLGSLGQD